MKREKKLFELPSLTSMEGRVLTINELDDIEDAFASCSNGCDDGCSDGVGSSYKASPGLMRKCSSCYGE